MSRFGPMQRFVALFVLLLGLVHIRGATISREDLLQFTQRMRMDKPSLKFHEAIGQVNQAPKSSL